MFIPPSGFKLLQRGMDRWRPGWRERAAKRKSAWDFAGFILGFALFPVFWYYLFQGVWLLHVHFFPEHAGHKSEFWGEGISGRAFASSFFMVIPLFWPALVGAFLLSNVVMWFVRPARRVMEKEAAGDPEMTFRVANMKLIRCGGLGSVLCFVLSFIGLATLHSLR
jgi:hypothetical protein